MIRQPSFDDPTLVGEIAGSRSSGSPQNIRDAWDTVARFATRFARSATAALRRPSEARRRRRIVSSLALKNCRVLEVNVGHGFGIAAYDPSCDVVGTDTSSAALTAARIRIARNNLDHVSGLHRVRGANLRFADEMFDAVTAFFVFNRGNRPSEVLTELLRVTRPGGRLVVVDHMPSRWYHVRGRRAPARNSRSANHADTTGASSNLRRAKFGGRSDTCEPRSTPRMLACCPDLDLVRERTLGALHISEFARRATA